VATTKQKYSPTTYTLKTISFIFIGQKQLLEYKKLSFISLFFFFIGFAQAQTSTSILSQEVSYPREAHSVRFYLNDLKDKGFRISYVYNHIDLEKLIIPSRENCSLASFLKDILREQPLYISEGNGKVIIALRSSIKDKDDVKGDNTIYIFCSDLENPKSCVKPLKVDAAVMKEQ
jgi:hypothetical protein